MKTRLIALLLVLVAGLTQAADKQANQFTERTTLGDDDAFYFEWLDGASYRGRHIKGDSLATAIGGKLNLSGTYQGLDATLTSLAGLTISSGKIPYGSGSDTFSTFDSTSFGRGLLNSADASAVLSTLGTASLYQGLDATLTALGGLTITSGKIAYGTGSDTFGTVDSTSFGRSLLNAADAAALRTLAELSGSYQPLDNSLTNLTQARLGTAGLVIQNTGADLSSLAAEIQNVQSATIYNQFKLLGSGDLFVSQKPSGWENPSQYTLDFTHADGDAVTITFPSTTSTLAVYPSFTGNANKVLAVNSGATGVEWVTPSSGVTDADYITKTANAGLSAEFALGSLATGLLKVTTTTGDLSSITSSSGLDGVISDNTGNGALVFNTSPTISGGSITGLTTFTSSDTNFSVDSNGNLVAKYFKLNNSASGATSLFLAIASGAVPSTVSGFAEIAKVTGGALYLMPGGSGTVLGGTAYLSGNLNTSVSSDADRNVQIGDDSSTPGDAILSGPDGTGTNATGGALKVQGGNGTGTGGSGPLIVEMAPAGSSGSTANTMAQVFKIDNTGAITLGQTVKLCIGTGSPESVVTANVGSLYLRTDGGANTTLYIKESGTGNTGWLAK